MGMQSQEVAKGDKWGQDGCALHGAEQQDEDARPGAGHLAGSGAVVLAGAAGRRRWEVGGCAEQGWSDKI